MNHAYRNNNYVIESLHEIGLEDLQHISSESQRWIVIKHLLYDMNRNLRSVFSEIDEDEDEEAFLISSQLWRCIKNDKIQVINGDWLSIEIWRHYETDSFVDFRNIDGTCTCICFILGI